MAPARMDAFSSVRHDDLNSLAAGDVEAATQWLGEKFPPPMFPRVVAIAMIVGGAASALFAIVRAHSEACFSVQFPHTSEIRPDDGMKCLILLALPRGLEPLFSP